MTICIYIQCCIHNANPNPLIHTIFLIIAVSALTSLRYFLLFIIQLVVFCPMITINTKLLEYKGRHLKVYTITTLLDTTFILIVINL